MQKAKLAAIKAKRAKQKVMKAKYRAKKEAKDKAVAENDAAPSESESEDGVDTSPAKPPAAKKRRVNRDVEDEGQTTKAVPSTSKQKPSTDLKPSRAVLPLTKASKLPKGPIVDVPSNRSEKSTVKPKHKLVTKSTTSPLKVAVSNNCKMAKKRKQPYAVS